MILIASILIVISLFHYIWFSIYEGNDERGKGIMANSSQIAFVFIILGFVTQGFYFRFGNPSIEKVQTLIYIWMALVFVSNSIGIILHKRKA